MFVPRRRIHERFNKQSKGMRRIDFKSLEQLTERLRFTTAARQIVRFVADFVPQKPLHRRKVDEVTDRAHPSTHTQQIADGRAIRITAGQRREILEAQFARGLPDRRKDYIRRIEPLTGATISRQTTAHKHRLK